jgi:hypothetical protein
MEIEDENLGIEHLVEKLRQRKIANRDEGKNGTKDKSLILLSAARQFFLLACLLASSQWCFT